MDDLHILADANIPCVGAAFERFGTVRTLPGREMGPSDVEAADVLLVRSVTPVGPALLRGTSLRFVGSATIGTDHVDRAYLRAQDIPFAHAPGSNADSVADYIVAALLVVASRRSTSLRGRTVGIVGCGNIGGRLAHRLSGLGLTVLQNDPPRAREAEAEGRAHDFLGLSTVLDRADIVTLHVPLTTDGPDPTHHLANDAFFDRLNDGAWFFNTSRGSVVDGEALRKARAAGPVSAAGLDVWENEPVPDPALMDVVDLATPHIAGYAYDGKVRGTRMLYDALCEELEVKGTWDASAVLRPASKDALGCTPPDPRLPEPLWLDHLARQAYDLRRDDADLRAIPSDDATARAEAFKGLRAGYRRRREMQRYAVPASALPAAYVEAVERGLTIGVN